MKPVKFGIRFPVVAVLFLGASLLGIVQAQSTPTRMTLLSPSVLTMQTPIGEARMEIPTGFVIENGALVRGGIQIEHGTFTGWIPIEAAKFPASKAKTEDVPSTPSPTPTPSSTAVPIIEPIKPYEQPENSLIAFIVLLGAAIFIALYATTSTQKWFPRIFRK